MGLLELLVAAIVVSVPVSVYGDTNPVEASALGSLYSGLNSPPQLTNWNANGGDPCGQSWRGITCSGPNVTEIKLSGLGLAGSVGFQLDKLLSVSILDLSHNNLGNEMPYQLPPNVEQLNIAGNNFSGSLPYSISQMFSLKLLNAGHNHLQGQLQDMFGQLGKLTSLDLSFNNFTGNLPHSFISLTNMTSMYLQNNNFLGAIDVLSTLPLENLNVENNNFSGWIPNQLKGKNLQIGGNTWSSLPAPPPPPFTPPPSRKTNPGSRSDGHGSSSNGSGNGKASGLGSGVIAGIVLGIVVISAIVAFFLVKRKSRKSPSEHKLELDRPLAPVNETKEVKSFQIAAPVAANIVDSSISLSLKPPPVDPQKSFDSDDMSTGSPIPGKKANFTAVDATVFSVADLQMATGSFSMENLIGEGLIGRVYRAKFEDDKVLAVKKINPSALHLKEEADFLEIVSGICRLHHPNVVELVGYCSEHGQRLLVYEFFRNGSLHDFLHLSDEYNKPLAWSPRVKIALGSARALEYLHEVCSPSVIHKNFKSANILLDNELNPHLSDSGLSSFFENTEHENANSGYSAPEVTMSGQYTMKSDVYSFGVVMLELLTGRKPFDSSRPRLEQSLVQWATPQLHDIDALANMVDPALEGLYPPKSLSRLADVVALCVQPEPEFRPPMSEVVQALVRLVQRANMSKRTLSGDDSRLSRRGSDLETHENIS